MDIGMGRMGETPMPLSETLSKGIRGKVLLLVVAVVVAVAAGGCDKIREFFSVRNATTPNKADEKVVVPPHVVGTVAEFARMVGGGDLAVQGYGVVVGLGTSGSKEVPPHLNVYLSKQLAKHHLGSYRHGTEKLSPARLLQDLDTAVVMVAGIIPPGAPEGSRFDLGVSALRQTSTRSLDGGILMPMELHLAHAGLATPGGPSKALATASGPIFVNPYLDSDKTVDLPKFRRGRVPNGGRVLHGRPVLLRLRRPDYALCDLIQRKINARFPFNDVRVANAESRQIIRIRIPAAYRAEYRHFLDLITHLPVRTGAAGGEVHARQIAQAMELPTAKHEELALVWEATGRQVVPIMRPLYSSKNPLVAYYSARTGLRLGDSLAAEVVLRFAELARSPLRVPAIKELGRHPQVVQAVPILERLLQVDNELVRIAAYEALLQRGDSRAIVRIDVTGRFYLDLVESRRDYVIYATQSGQPRIVLFGKNMTVARPIFFLAPGELVSINANTETGKLTVRRKIPRTNTTSDAATIDHYARSLIRLLGETPNPEATGLGLTYSQVVAVLQRLCTARNIRARFVLQEAQDAATMFDSAITSGRPDMPES